MHILDKYSVHRHKISVYEAMLLLLPYFLAFLLFVQLCSKNLQCTCFHAGRKVEGKFLPKILFTIRGWMQLIIISVYWYRHMHNKYNDLCVGTDEIKRNIFSCPHLENCGASLRHDNDMHTLFIFYNNNMIIVMKVIGKYCRGRAKQRNPTQSEKNEDGQVT